MRRLALAGLLLLAACGDGRLRHDPDRAVPNGEVPAVYAALESRDGARIEAALERILGQEDRRFIAVLIESLRLSHLSQAESHGYNARVVALERLSGQSFGGDWFRWVEWYATTALEPPPGFLDFKDRFLTRIDLSLAGFLREGTPARIRPELIRWGGVLPGDIPALTNPALERAEAAGWLAPDEPVVGLVHRGEARAYPLRILDWHEIVNDRFDGDAVTVSDCTLAGSALAFRAGAAEGASHSFETSGLVYRSNKLMFDHRTRTLWSQLDGRPVLGPLAARDSALPALPVVVTTWAAWRAQHPGTSVLSLDTGHRRDYVLGTPYGSYFAAGRTLFPVGGRDERLPAKAQVYGIAQGAPARAWPLEALVEARVLNDVLGELPVTLVATRGLVEVEARVPGSGPLRYVSGAEVRAYRRGSERFSLPPTAGERDVLLDADGSRWRVTEDALLGGDGRRAERLPGAIAYWFAWRTTHPETEVYEP